MSFSDWVDALATILFLYLDTTAIKIPCLTSAVP